MSFTDGKPHIATEKEVASFKRVNKRTRLRCSLCNVIFEPGMTYRFIYANGTPNAHCGNFFVCEKCDGPDVLQKAIIDYNQAVELSKKWGIYGPDWQE